MTPANIRAIRMRCGLSVKECAKVLSLNERQVETMERANWNIVFMEHYRRLSALEVARMEYVQKLIDERPLVLIGYQEFDYLVHHEPEAFNLQSNVVHRMALAEAQALLGADGHDVDIVEIVPKAYAEWRAGAPDTHAERQAWALERRQQFKIVPVGG